MGSSDSPSKPFRILVIDDDPDVCEMIAELLEAADYEVVRAESGAAGCERAITAYSDLILVDYGMPGLDGVTTVQRLKSAPETRAIPVVALTASLGPEANRMVEAGCIGYIPKPFDPRTFARVVREFLTVTAAPSSHAVGGSLGGYCGCRLATRLTAPVSSSGTFAWRKDCRVGRRATIHCLVAGPHRGRERRVIATPKPLRSTRGDVTRPRATPAPSRRATTSVPPDLGPRLDGVVVLVVEDHPETLDMLDHFLEGLGARSLLAANGRTALRVLATTRPHVILCDLLLPDMDGLAFAYYVRLDPRWRRIPMIAITALNGDADHIRTWAHGFAAHLTKPLNLFQLAAEIRRQAGLPRGRGRRASGQ